MVWYSLPSAIPLYWETPRRGGEAELRSDWARLLVIATVARLLCHTGHIRDETPDSDSRPRGYLGVLRRSHGRLTRTW